MKFFELIFIFIKNPNKVSVEEISSSTEHTQHAAVYRLLWLRRRSEKSQGMLGKDKLETDENAEQANDLDFLFSFKFLVPDFVVRTLSGISNV